VSSAEHFVRHHNDKPIRAISAAFVRLAADESARECFARCCNTYGCGHRGSPRCLSSGRHHGIEALVNLRGTGMHTSGHRDVVGVRSVVARRGELARPTPDHEVPSASVLEWRPGMPPTRHSATGNGSGLSLTAGARASGR